MSGGTVIDHVIFNQYNLDLLMALLSVMLHEFGCLYYLAVALLILVCFTSNLRNLPFKINIPYACMDQKKIPLE